MTSLPKIKQINYHHYNRIQDYKLIQELHQSEEWSIVFMCEQLEIKRSSYYKWLNSKPTQRQKENDELLGYIRKVTQSNNSLFGSEKMTMYINHKYATQYNHKRIYRIMCINDLKSSFRKKSKYNYKRSKPEIIAENVLNREFNASQPNEKWCTDVTEIKVPKTGEKLYISPIIDLYDRYPVGLVVSSRNDTILTNGVLQQAITLNPTAHPLYQSDRGFQYTRKIFKAKLKDYGMTQSMSRVSKCIDNGVCEGFQGLLKDMLTILYPNIANKQEMIEAIYNTRDYYINEYPQKRFKGKSAGQVREEALKTSSPNIYPIKPNKKYINFWNHIDEVKSILTT